MAVNIEFAVSENKLIHISKRLSKDKTYCCPSCGESVIAKKGPINTHHFAHKSDSSCTANKETMLHLFAKHILVTESVQLQFPISLFQQSQAIANTMGQYIHMEYINIPLDDVFDYLQTFDPEGKTETSVGKYVADVLFSDTAQGNEDLVVEVFVTHAIEDDKRDYFNEIGLPYIEVQPKMNKDEIIFTVTDTNLNEFIEGVEERLANDLLNHTYTSYRGVLLTKLKDELIDFEKVELEKSKALELLLNEINDINLRDYIDRKLYEEMSTIPATGTNGFERVEKVENTKITYRKKPHMLCNGMYVNYETGILRSFIEYCLKERIDVDAIIEKSTYNGKDGITGFNFRLPRNTITGDLMKDILKEMVLKM